MAIELGVNRAVSYINVEPQKMPYSFLIKLGDKTFRLTFRYNHEADFFTVDLETSSGEPLCYGDPIRYGRPLFGAVEDERFPQPVIIPECLTGGGTDTITFDNLGQEVKLYLHERQGGA